MHSHPGLALSSHLVSGFWFLKTALGLSGEKLPMDSTAPCCPLLPKGLVTMRFCHEKSPCVAKGIQKSQSPGTEMTHVREGAMTG